MKSHSLVNTLHINSCRFKQCVVDLKLFCNLLTTLLNNAGLFIQALRIQQWDAPSVQRLILSLNLHYVGASHGYNIMAT
jgi:invasion protein IalB